MLAGVGPQLGDRSLVLVALAVVGAVSGTLLFSAAVRNGRGALALLLVSVWIAINVANVANTQLFQRYVDTPSLILLGWMSALALAGRSDADRRASVGPALLTVILATLILVVTGV